MVPGLGVMGTGFKSVAHSSGEGLRIAKSQSAYPTARRVQGDALAASATAWASSNRRLKGESLTRRSRSREPLRSQCRRQRREGTLRTGWSRG